MTVRSVLSDIGVCKDVIQLIVEYDGAILT